MINCGDCERALNPYLDRELSEEDLVQVREHLDACSGCLHRFAFEESLRRLVRVRCQEQAAPDSLRQRITVTFAIERTRTRTRKRSD